MSSAPKVNWKIKGAKRIEEVFGYSEADSFRLFDSVYRRALRLFNKSGVRPKEVNVAQEVFNSMVSSRSQVFEIQVTDYVNKEVKFKYEAPPDPFKNYVSERFHNMAMKYGDVGVMLSEYQAGNISYSDFINGVKEFKKQSAEYQKSGSPP